VIPVRPDDAGFPNQTADGTVKLAAGQKKPGRNRIEFRALFAARVDIAEYRFRRAA